MSRSRPGEPGGAGRESVMMVTEAEAIRAGEVPGAEPRKSRRRGARAEHFGARSDTSRSRMAGRIRALDGLRGVSIVLVLLGHLTGTRGFPQWWTPMAGLAHIGVLAFFVLSGFLITSLLMAEQLGTRGISLRRFYLRRLLRIVPVAYVYIGVVAALAAARLTKLAPHDVPFALFFLMDYHPDRAWPLGHLWSLSVEEQFYLLWPPALAFLGPTRARQAICALLLLISLGGMLLEVFLPGRPRLLRFPVGAESVATGCLLALTWGRLKNHGVLASVWFSVALVVAVAAQIHLWNIPRTLPGLGLAINFLLALFVLRCIVRPEQRLTRLLASRVLSTIGTFSYSLYIWQELFLDRMAPSSVFPLNLLMAIATAMASYWLIERPFLNLKASLT